MSQKIAGFDLWQMGYGGASVLVVIANTITPAALFLDQALTIPAPNPQTLLNKSSPIGDAGKFGQPLYTAGPYQLYINATDVTGIIAPPINDLTGLDASAMVATATGAVLARTIADFYANEVDARNFGEIGPTQAAATNTTTITSAIAAAAALGGAKVLLPDGVIPFNQLTLPAGVLLYGRGRGVTVLQSQTAGKVITVSGDRAGLAFLDLDGVSLQAGSIGFFSEAHDELRLYDVTVKRFETGMQFQGGRRMNWQQLFVDNCVWGVRSRGDSNASGDGNGDQWRNNLWRGGRVTACSTMGLELAFVDLPCFHNTIDYVGFENNTGIAYVNTGARFTNMPRCWWTGNTTNWQLSDGSDPTKADENTIVDHVIGPDFSVDGGTGTFAGNCQNVVFDKGEFTDSAVLSFNLVKNNILARDCTEDSTITLTGTDSIRWERAISVLDQPGGTAGLTTDATVTNAYKYSPADGETGTIEAWIVGVRRDGVDHATYHVGQAFSRPGATLAYQSQTANFTVGDILTGQSSGAEARIISDSDSGSSGTVTLKDITQEFTNGEVITSSSGGSATTAGVLAHQAAALFGSTTRIEADNETDSAWNVAFAVSGFDVYVTVAGASGKTVEWNVHARIVSS